MAETRSAMEEAGRRFLAAHVDTLLLIDVDLVHRQNKSATRTLYTGEPMITVSLAPRAGGVLGLTRDSFACDASLAHRILSDGRESSFPVLPAAGEDGEVPLFGGALIPLWYTIRLAAAPRPQLVVITPSPGVSRKELWRFGRWLGELATQSGKRIAIAASADQGHTHDVNNPKFGFSPASARYDSLYCEAVRQNRLDRLLDVEDQMLRDSWSDSLWQTLVLAGVLEANPLLLTFFSYAVPTYFGMAVAVYEPGPSPTPP